MPANSLVIFAFDTLYSKLTKTPPHSLAQIKALISEDAKYPAKAPLFVTWNKLERGDYDLRGCIGTFSEQPLEAGLKRYALIAALEDTRFEPISTFELPVLQCCVTLLDKFEIANDAYDWEIGRHGIIIDFSTGNRSYNATFLPDVMVEQGWDKDETLKHLIKKSGYYSKDYVQKVIPLIQLTRYEGVKSSITYDEYKKIMNL